MGKSGTHERMKGVNVEIGWQVIRERRESDRDASDGRLVGCER